MEITAEQYEKIKDSLPIQRGNVRLNNLQVLNAFLFVAEQGCKWRGQAKRFGNWHTIYVHMNRWAIFIRSRGNHHTVTQKRASWQNDIDMSYRSSTLGLDCFADPFSDYHFAAGLSTCRRVDGKQLGI